MKFLPGFTFTLQLLYLVGHHHKVREANPCKCNVAIKSFQSCPKKSIQPQLPSSWLCMLTCSLKHACSCWGDHPHGPPEKKIFGATKPWIWDFTVLFLSSFFFIPLHFSDEFLAGNVKSAPNGSLQTQWSPPHADFPVLVGLVPPAMHETAWDAWQQPAGTGTG